MVENPLVSIVVPIVRNDPHIEEAIWHIDQQTYDNIETIVVDEGLERSAQRNIGIRRAKGKYLLILDSDMMIMPDLIKECVWILENYPRVVALYIPERIVTKGWFGKLRDWERQFYNGSLVDVERFVRAESCPMFDETLHGVEDSDWARQIKGVKVTTNNHFNHHDKCGVIKYLRKKAYYAQCLNKYKRKNPDDKLLTLKYRCWQVFVEKGKWKRLIKAPHMALAMFLLVFARGVIFVWQTRKYK